MSGHTKKDEAERSDQSVKDVSRTWHQARDDSGAREGRDTEHFEKPPTSAPQTTDSGIPLFPNRK